MKISSSSFNNGDRIPGEFAFCIIEPSSHITLSDNRNPQLSWSEAPAGTKSFAIICHDPDVPSSGESVNQEGKSVPASLPRVDFYHWVLLNLPATVNELKAGEFSAGVTARGKPGPQAPHGSQQGINSYTDWFAGDKDMSGDYYGYDGPCPPWNDEIIHRYIFTVYALDSEKITVSDKLTGGEALAVIKPHILAQASLSGTYTLNPQLA